MKRLPITPEDFDRWTEEREALFEIEDTAGKSYDHLFGWPIVPISGMEYEKLLLAGNDPRILKLSHGNPPK